MALVIGWVLCTLLGASLSSAASQSSGPKHCRGAPAFWPLLLLQPLEGGRGTRFEAACSLACLQCGDGLEKGEVGSRLQFTPDTTYRLAKECKRNGDGPGGVRLDFCTCHIPKFPRPNRARKSKVRDGMHPQRASSGQPDSRTQSCRKPSHLYFATSC